MFHGLNFVNQKSDSSLAPSVIRKHIKEYVNSIKNKRQKTELIAKLKKH